MELPWPPVTPVIIGGVVAIQTPLKTVTVLDKGDILLPTAVTVAVIVFPAVSKVLEIPVKVHVPVALTVGQVGWPVPPQMDTPFL
ncbi:hypothetical protein GCM10023188_06670 [Pontibacter saemangeumensis]|uniref:Uncharacterized protein n=1 Tax=Pontibacter saemangeumensis TaxID=1084525 RepID=A0ABP8LBZ4_9BACT